MTRLALPSAAWPRELLLTGGLLAACAPSRPVHDPYPPDQPALLTSAPPTASAVPVPPVSQDCPADPVPVARPRVEGKQPFVEFVPYEEIHLTPAKSPTETRFGAVACQANLEVWRDDDGRVRVCTVARRIKLEGIDIAAGAYTRFHADGRAAQTHLARPQDLRTARGEEVACAADLVVLSSSGALGHCTLARNATLGGVSCRKGESVSFHPTGELAQAVIDRPAELLGTQFTAGTSLRWYPSGALRGGWLPEPLRVLGYLIRWHFTLHEGGTLQSFELAEKRSIQGQELPERAKVELRADGSLSGAVYEVRRGFMPHGEMWNDTKHVRFDCHGKVVAERVEHWQADKPPPFIKRR